MFYTSSYLLAPQLDINVYRYYYTITHFGIPSLNETERNSYQTISLVIHYCIFVFVVSSQYIYHYQASLSLLYLCICRIKPVYPSLSSQSFIIVPYYLSYQASISIIIKPVFHCCTFVFVVSSQYIHNYQASLSLSYLCICRIKPVYPSLSSQSFIIVPLYLSYQASISMNFLVKQNS